MINFASVTLVASGSPQQIGQSINPAPPSTISAGVTSPSPARYPQVVIQSNPTNIGSVFIGGAQMNKATFANVGAVLAPGASLNLGRAGGSISLDELWFDGATTGDVLLLALVG
jgi:hypothetical protein